MSRKPTTAGKLLDAGNSPARNHALATFGNSVESAEQEAIFKIVGLFEQAERRQGKARDFARRFAECEFQRIIGPLLNAAMRQQKPCVFRQIADAIDEAKRAKSQGPKQPFHARSISLAEQLTHGEFVPGKPLPVTLAEFKQRFFQKVPAEAQQSNSYCRREWKQIGIEFQPARNKGGRPRKENRATILPRRKS